MKKGLITIILTFILIFNTYSPTFATTPDPAAAIPVTAYEVYTYFTLVLTYMGVEYKNAQERKQWLEDEYGPETPTYQSVEDILRQAKINFSNEPPNYNPKPEPRQIAIPVPDNLIDNLSNKILSFLNNSSGNNIEDTISFFDSYYHSGYQVDYKVYYDGAFYYVYSTDKDLQLVTYNSGSNLRIKNDVNTNINMRKFDNNYNYITQTNNLSFNITDLVFIYEVIDYSYGEINLPIIIPESGLITSWTSPYTGMQTVTMPVTTTGIESPVEIPVIPGEYVEPAPEEVPNPISQPEDDPLINPETGLPFIDPETGLPIFPVGPLVPTTPITPIPQPQPLEPGQSIDYRPNLTEIGNDIKQLPEKIINPIKSLFIPDKINTIDFSPLNVPVTKKFPFSIPFDLARMFENLSSGGEAPKWDINLVFMDYSETLTIDLARFEKWAEITRFFVFIGFNIGLILVTRNLIRG